MTTNIVNEKVRNNRAIWTRNDRQMRSSMILNLSSKRKDQIKKISAREHKEDFNFNFNDFKYEIQKIYAAQLSLYEIEQSR